ncbi:MAG: hypothetical protein EOM20_12115, partial [Spartobacteria bacterium]|nr:hypothetical protein [Spartobacteria bacterium]
MDQQYKKIILFSVIGLSVGALLTGLVLFMGYRTCRASRETIAAVHQLIDENSGPGEKSAGRSAAAADIAARHTATHPTQYATAQVEETLDQLEDINAALLRDLDSLEAENFTLQELNDKLKVQIEDILNWVLVNYEGKHPLPMESVPALSFAPMDNELMLNPEVAEFLHITPAEEATINDAFAYARSVINQVEDELMTYTFPHPDKAILQIPPFYEDGELLR